ncbi:MAG: hypothetical protein HFI86_07205 [Bacilli bacterium]|nr:hypothetical protein [Bacilli bacterium]
MNFGSNFNNRKLFTGESKSTTRSIDMRRFNERNGARSVDEVRMARIKLKDQLNTNMCGPGKDRKEIQAQPVKQNSQTNAERQFNHIEAMRNIKRGI